MNYLGDITSCSKVEHYLMCSEYCATNGGFNIEYSDFKSNDVSMVHFEQFTAPINKKKFLQKVDKITASVSQILRFFLPGTMT